MKRKEKHPHLTEASNSSGTELWFYGVLVRTECSVWVTSRYYGYGWRIQSALLGV